MSQREILDILQKHPNVWFNTINLSELLEQSRPSLSANLMRMKKFPIKHLEFNTQVTDVKTFKRELIFVRWKE